MSQSNWEVWVVSKVSHQISRRRASAQMHLKWWQTVGPLLASQFMNVQVLRYPKNRSTLTKVHCIGHLQELKRLSHWLSTSLYSAVDTPNTSSRFGDVTFTKNPPIIGVLPSRDYKNHKIAMSPVQNKDSDISHVIWDPSMQTAPLVPVPEQGARQWSGHSGKGLPMLLAHCPIAPLPCQQQALPIPFPRFFYVCLCESCCGLLNNSSVWAREQSHNRFLIAIQPKSSEFVCTGNCNLPKKPWPSKTFTAIGVGKGNRSSNSRGVVNFTCHWSKRNRLGRWWKPFGNR